jgi:hypothetical protein
MQVCGLPDCLGQWIPSLSARQLVALDLRILRTRKGSDSQCIDRPDVCRLLPTRPKFDRPLQENSPIAPKLNFGSLI